MTRHWYATATANNLPAPTDNPDLHQHILDTLSTISAATATHHADTGRATLGWRLDAPTLLQALQHAHAAARDALGAPPAGLSVIPLEDHEHPFTELDLIGYKEAGDLLGVTRQRVTELEKTHPDFPKPIARIAAGPVFTRASIQAFDARWVRKLGRPRKNPTT